MENPFGVKGLKYAKSTQHIDYFVNQSKSGMYILALFLFFLLFFFLQTWDSSYQVMSQTSNSSLEPGLSQETFNDLFNTIGQYINPQDLQG